MELDYKYLFHDENEKPLDRLVTDGGYARIFRTIACVGDSLSSGEFESLEPNGGRGYHDMFEFSWGQFMARTTGAKVYNFSRGGMTAKEYCESFAEANGFWDPEKKAQIYIIALGCNECYQNKAFVDDEFDKNVDVNDWHNNNMDSFRGSFATIIQRYKEIQPRAKFFLVTMANDPSHAYTEQNVRSQRQAMYEMAEHFDNCYVIDLYKYGPYYGDEFRKHFYLLGHLNPMGYALTADFILSYLDYIVRHNMDDFKELGYIGTDLHG